MEYGAWSVERGKSGNSSKQQGINEGKVLMISWKTGLIEREREVLEVVEF